MLNKVSTKSLHITKELFLLMRRFLKFTRHGENEINLGLPANALRV
jgi:hypothetical protein